MLIDELQHEIKRMNTLKKVREESQSQAQQKQKLSEFTQIINELYFNACTLKAAHEIMNYSADQDLSELMRDAFVKLKATYDNNYIDEDRLRESKNAVKKVRQRMIDDWSDFYEEMTATVNTNLHAIGSLVDDQNKLAKIKDAIDKGENWQTLGYSDDNTSNRLSNLSEALKDASTLIQNLNLQDNITKFLGKVAKGNAGINDLSEEIISWIKKEQLEDKFSLVFTSKH